MALNTSPPLTSGVVVLSGSDFFNRLTSDFPVLMELVLEDPGQYTPYSSSELILGNSPQVNSTGIYNYSIRGMLVTDPAGNEPYPNSLLLFGNSPQVNSSGIGSTAIKGLLHLSDAYVEADSTLFAQVLRIPTDTGIRSTPVTTSGVVILDLFPEAGVAVVVFVPPVVINARLYPLFQGPFPEHDRRIFPVLPQFSTLTPGD